MTDTPEMIAAARGIEDERPIEELIADWWIQRSQARVGSYQHECSSGPWLLLASVESELRARLRVPAIIDHIVGEGE